jgi:lipoyl(octanoyl) transferase
MTDVLCLEPETEGSNIRIRCAGLLDYLSAWQAMKEFTASRTGGTADEIWLLQHPPVYTQGIAGRPEHLLHNNGILVIRTDRGGQITYHGPGQVIAYLMLDLRRLKLGVRELVRKMEGAVVDLLQDPRVRLSRCPRRICGWRKSRSPGAENKKWLLLPRPGA